MKLKSIDLDELLKGDVHQENVFVLIPFLYSPVMLELKRIEKEIDSIYLRINEEKLDKDPLILTLLRLFSTPENFSETEKTCHLLYENKKIIIEYYHDGPVYSGKCTSGEANLLFSEEMPFIRIENPTSEDSIIVLPEGDGEYYLNLDKEESERAERCSIIGDPGKLQELYRWLGTQSRG